ncbi:transposase family protein [Lachnospiraceae bacterium 46-61]
MKEIYLTVKQLAEIKGCTERYIRNCITKEKIEAIQIEGQVGGNAGTHYSIPLLKLDEKVQLQYKRYLKKLQKEAEKQVQKQEIQQEQESKSMKELTEKEKENAMFWRKLLESWQSYRGKETDKQKADNEFIKVMNVQNEGLHLSRRTLYRKWNSFVMQGEVALTDGRGRHDNHSRKMTREIFDVFEYYYLNENKPSIKQCMRETILYFEGQDIEMPCYTTFKRSVEKIPNTIKMYFREREKVFIDKCAPYIKRMYDDLESNDIWVADNHTFDIMVEKEGKPVRVYLTAFMDVRSRKMMGWCVTDAPSSDATIYALKKGCEKFGVPRSIYTDNGREFLFHDLGGNGFRKKKKKWRKIEIAFYIGRFGCRISHSIAQKCKRQRYRKSILHGKRTV